jgi:hypothetical protein
MGMPPRRLTAWLRRPRQPPPNDTRMSGCLARVYCSVHTPRDWISVRFPRQYGRKRNTPVAVPPSVLNRIHPGLIDTRSTLLQTSSPRPIESLRPTNPLPLSTPIASASAPHYHSPTDYVVIRATVSGASCELRESGQRLKMSAKLGFGSRSTAPRIWFAATQSDRKYSAPNTASAISIMPPQEMTVRVSPCGILKCPLSILSLRARD